MYRVFLDCVVKKIVNTYGSAQSNIIHSSDFDLQSKSEDPNRDFSNLDQNLDTGNHFGISKYNFIEDLFDTIEESHLKPLSLLSNIQLRLVTYLVLQNFQSESLLNFDMLCLDHHLQLLYQNFHSLPRIPFLLLQLPISTNI